MNQRDGLSNENRRVFWQQAVALLQESGLTSEKPKCPNCRAAGRPCLSRHSCSINTPGVSCHAPLALNRIYVELFWSCKPVIERYNPRSF